MKVTIKVSELEAANAKLAEEKHSINQKYALEAKTMKERYDLLTNELQNKIEKLIKAQEKAQKELHELGYEKAQLNENWFVLLLILIITNE